MSAALRIRTKVLPGHRIEFAAPELPEGEDVEVSVVVADLYEMRETEARFRELARRWKAETAAQSSPSQIAMHPAYQELIGLGQAVVPFILRDLQQQPGHWFWALRAITGEDPIRPEERGKVREMAAAWIQWGRLHGHIS